MFTYQKYKSTSFVQLLIIVHLDDSIDLLDQD